MNSEFLVPSWGITLVHYFFGLSTGDAYDLDRDLEKFSGVIPSDVISIASDPSGNRVCIGLEGDKRSKIFFWIHDQPKLELIPLARDFDDFMNLLVPDGSLE